MEILFVVFAVLTAAVCVLAGISAIALFIALPGVALLDWIHGDEPTESSVWLKTLIVFAALSPLAFAMVNIVQWMNR